MRWLLSVLGIIPAISLVGWSQTRPKTVEKRGVLPEDVGMLSMQILQLIHLCLLQTKGNILLTQRR